jgi:hypothetical protein
MMLFSPQILKGLAMVYNTWSHWVSELWPSSGILDTRNHNVSGEGKAEIQPDSLSETLCFFSI